METEERGYEFGEVETGGEDDQATGGVFYKVGDYVLVELDHRWFSGADWRQEVVQFGLAAKGEFGKWNELFVVD